MEVLQSCLWLAKYFTGKVHKMCSLRCNFFVVCLFYCNHFTIEGLQKAIFEKLSLEPCMDVLSQTLIQVIKSTVLQHRENIKKLHLCLTLVMFFSMHTVLTNNIHINCSVLWFTKAIVCCTGIISCISPVDVCYSQYFSFLHHNSISLVPRLLFGPSNVWY